MEVKMAKTKTKQRKNNGMPAKPPKKSRKDRK